jgi:hypothetical protein
MRDHLQTNPMEHPKVSPQCVVDHVKHSCKSRCPAGRCETASSERVVVLTYIQRLYLLQQDHVGMHPEVAHGRWIGC